MTNEERSQIMDTISAAGDAEVLKFAGHCMRLLESAGQLTDEDARDYATARGLL